MKKLIDNEFFPYQLLRQTSKWVKNGVAVVWIIKYILEERQGDFNLNFAQFINFHEMGPKTTSLLMYSVFGKISTVPAPNLYKLPELLNP